MDVLAVGDVEASSLGVQPGRVRLVLVAFATLGTAAVVAVSGLIGFVGIIVHHTFRLLTGTSFRIVVQLSVLVGGAFLVIADLIARTVLAPFEVPIGVVTAYSGAPVFAGVRRKSQGIASGPPRQPRRWCRSSQSRLPTTVTPS